MQKSDGDPDLRVIETDLDDATPETLGSLPDELRAAGAKQVSVIPTTGKQARPGHLVRAIVRPGDADAVARRLARETGTLGVRELPATHRIVADTHRRTAVLELDGDRYEIDVKIASLDGDVYDLSAERSAVESVATAVDRPSREIAARAEAAVRGDPTDSIVHLVAPDEWENHATEEPYQPASVAEEGFVHCSKPDQVPAVADTVHAEDDALLALVIDPARLEAPVIYEPGPIGHYPHVYGPVDQDAIRRTVSMERDDGHWTRPDLTQ